MKNKKEAIVVCGVGLIAFSAALFALEQVLMAISNFGNDWFQFACNMIYVLIAIPIEIFAIITAIKEGATK